VHSQDKLVHSQDKLVYSQNKLVHSQDKLVSKIFCALKRNINWIDSSLS
jgi:cellobiose-specific phosphotransferase system component IIA